MECFQGSIFINQANVTFSDDVSVNGIFHEIDKILRPPDMYRPNEPDGGVSTAATTTV